MKAFLSLRQVVERTALGRTSIYKLVADGDFPKQVRITRGRVAWIAEEIEQWIDLRIAETRNRGPEKNSGRQNAQLDSSTGDPGLRWEQPEATR